MGSEHWSYDKLDWACPSCGWTGFVVGSVLHCANAGCDYVRDFDPVSGDLLCVEKDADRG